METLTLFDIQRAHQRISPFIHRTPVIHCHTLDEMCGRKLYLKAECFQKCGSFKARGALNAILHLKEKLGEIPGIVTYSSGNHGQAVAYASRIVDCPCTIVVPSNTSEVKIEAMLGYGADIVFCEPNPVSRLKTCQRICEELGQIFVHTSDNYKVIAGQGTTALEFLQEQPDLDAIFVPISGGGLASGVAVAAKSINPNCKVFAVEPQGKELQTCLESGQRLWPNPPQFVDTIGDGLRSQQLGQLTFPIVSSLCEKTVLSVDDQQMIAAMKLLWERAKIVVEVSSSITLAAAISDQVKNLDPKIKKIGLILSGGNCDLDKLPWLNQSK